MGSWSSQFGRELRSRRLEAGLTLAELSARVHYSKGQLSKVERGLKPATRELARLCDSTLGADGDLAALVPGPPPETDLPEVAANDGSTEIWIMQLTTDGASWFQPVGRRDLMKSGAAAAMSIGLGGAGSISPTADRGTVESFRLLFDQYRLVGQSMNPAALLPALIAQTHAIREMSVHADPRTRQELLHLGSRYAEYIGWLVQETGDDNGALWWTGRAVELAAAAGDQDLAAYALVRRALVTLYREDGDQTVALARRAQDTALPARIRGLAAQREAQGHAINGDHSACLRALDEARLLLAVDEADSPGPVIGTTNLSDPVSMITGWCLYDLGRPAQAAEVMERELAVVPAHALRTRLRYGTRQARALAAAGEIDQACDLTSRILADTVAVGSATIATDLRELAHILRRHPRSRAVRELAPDLGMTLGLVRKEDA